MRSIFDKGKDRHCGETESELVAAPERGCERSRDAWGDSRGDSTMIWGRPEGGWVRQQRSTLSDQTKLEKCMKWGVAAQGSFHPCRLKKKKKGPRKPN